MAFHCAAGDDRNPVQKREMSCNAQRSVISEGVDKAFRGGCRRLGRGHGSGSSQAPGGELSPPDAASRAEHLFESEDVELMAQFWRLSRWAWDKATAF